MKGLFYILTIFGGLIGGLILITTLVSANGAPQEAAGAAIAVAFVVIPYCMARAFELIGEESLSKIMKRYLDEQKEREAVFASDTSRQDAPSAQPVRPVMQPRQQTGKQNPFLAR